MVIAQATYSDNLMFVFGGLALFLFGINLMSDSLKAAAGSNLKKIIEKATNTPLKGILVGILLTSLIQSSSGTTALMIGLLRAGLMTLPQAVGIIMGANIGTTITAFIIGLPIADYGLLMLSIGVVMMFFKRKSVHHIGGILVGLGMLFVGLNTMTNGLKPLANTNAAKDMFHTFSTHWFSGTLFGVAFTALVQSSSASIGVLQNLYALNAQGVESISISGAVPILLGANIGTTMTAFLASIGGNIESKRASFIHTFFNVIGAIFFIICLKPYVAFVGWFELRFLKPYSMLTIAFAHGFQKIATTFILFFFIPQIIKISKFFIRDTPSLALPEEVFDEKLIQESPALALEFVKKALLNMGSTVKEYFDIVRTYSFKEESKLVQEGYAREMILDNYDQKLHDYLIKIAGSGISKKDSKKLSRDLDTIKDFERIGDHLTNILDFFKERYLESQLLTVEGTKDLEELYEVLDQMMTNTIEAFRSQNVEIAKKVIKDEDYVDELEEKFRYRYIERLKNKEVTFVKAANYPDILSNLERVGDHLMNIASSVIEPLYVPQNVIVPKPRELDLTDKENTKTIKK